MTRNVFQLTVLSQNDPGSVFGDQLSVVVNPPTGGTLTTVPPSSPVGTPVALPIPPAPGTTGPQPPTWLLELSDGIANAQYTLTISGPHGANPTHITIDGSNMPEWVTANEQEPTNQLYKKSSCGIFGYAQVNTPEGQPTTWIYPVTAGVFYPVVHCPG